jgi:serine/threonine protein kinase
MPAPPEVIAGTLAYMAPEQTGCMNRSLDTRSDRYSLGVTVYQTFTGRLPFAAADAMEWVHCHIARKSLAPDSRAPLPAPLSAIIMRLLAKTAEERYQTAGGLEADLRRCLTEWVAEACLKFGSIFRRARGLYISIHHRGRIAEVLRNWPTRPIYVPGSRSRYTDPITGSG